MDEDGPVSPATSAEGRELRRRISHLIDAIMAIDFRLTDEPGSLALAAASAPSMVDLSGLAIALLDQVQDHYDDGDNETGGDRKTESDAAVTELDEIGALISTTVAAHEVRDLAFVATGQIRSCLERLHAAIGSEKLLNIVSGADDALTRLRKGLIPVETALSEYEGETAPEREWIDLPTLLEARRIYGRLRRELLAVGDPADDELEARLTEVADRLAELRTADIYTFLRITDRVQIRALQRRISLWLREDQALGAKSGRLIWLELCTFVNLLIQINKRQELQEHDRSVIAGIYHALYANVRPPRTIPADILEQLRSLEGLDEELDMLILQGTTRNPKEWEAPIRRLWTEGDRAEAVMRGEAAGS